MVGAVAEVASVESASGLGATRQALDVSEVAHSARVCKKVCCCAWDALDGCLGCWDVVNWAVPGWYYTERCERSSISVICSYARLLSGKDSKVMCNCLGLCPAD